MPSTHAFSEKVALITGGTSPVGRAVAMQLALCGAYVVVAYQSDDPAVSDIEELKALGTLAAAAEYKKAGRDGAIEIAEAVDKLYGRLDLLVNCPAALDFKPFQEVTIDDFQAVVENHFESAFFNTRECLRLMEQRPKPRIVNIFSACDGGVSVRDIIGRSANASISEFTKALSEDLPRHFSVNGIRVSEVQANADEPESLDPDLFRQKSGVDPDDVARCALFLLSSEAKGLTGQILDVGAS